VITGIVGIGAVRRVEVRRASLEDIFIGLVEAGRLGGRGARGVVGAGPPGRSRHVIKILTAAVREYRSTALTRAFLFAVIVFPLLILAVVFMIGKSGLLESEEPPLEGVVLVQDTTRDRRGGPPGWRCA
jgi:hypothetical protein